MSGLVTVGYFLVSVVFGLATFILWTRFGLQYFRISSLNPISQMIYRLTNPICQPLARVLQIRPTRQQRYDWLCFGLLVVVGVIKFTLLGSLYFGQESVWRLIGIYTVADLINEPCNLLFYAVLIRVIMSWVNPTWQHPAAAILYGVTEPMLQRVQRYIPAVAGLDFSPFVVMIGLQMVTIFMRASLPFPIL